MPIINLDSKSISDLISYKLTTTYFNENWYNHLAFMFSIARCYYILHHFTIVIRKFSMKALNELIIWMRYLNSWRYNFDVEAFYEIKDT